MRLTYDDIKKFLGPENEENEQHPLAGVELSHEDIQAFIEAWKRDFGEVLTPECAESEIRRLLHFFGTLEAVLEGRTRPGELEERDELPLTPPLPFLCNLQLLTGLFIRLGRRVRRLGEHVGKTPDDPHDHGQHEDRPHDEEHRQDDTDNCPHPWCHDLVRLSF